MWQGVISSQNQPNQMEILSRPTSLKNCTDYPHMKIKTIKTQDHRQTFDGSMTSIPHNLTVQGLGLSPVPAGGSEQAGSRRSSASDYRASEEGNQSSGVSSDWKKTSVGDARVRLQNLLTFCQENKNVHKTLKTGLVELKRSFEEALGPATEGLRGGKAEVRSMVPD